MAITRHHSTNVRRRASIHNPEEASKTRGGGVPVFPRCKSRASPTLPSPSPSAGPSPVISASGKVLPMPKLPLSGGTLKKEHEITARPLTRFDRTLLGDAYMREGLRKPSQPSGPKGEKHPLLHFLATSPTQAPKYSVSPPPMASRSLDSAADAFGRAPLPIKAAHHGGHHRNGTLSNSKEQYQAIRDTIHEAFEEVDLDKNGVIDKFELGHLLSKIAPLDHPIDDLDAIFDDVDTDRNGVIDPMEFRAFLEANLTVAQNRQVPMNLYTLVHTAFREGLQRVRQERNIVTKAFLEASQMFGCNPSGNTTASKTSWVFKIYDRLHSEHVDPAMVEGGRSGRLAFLEEILKEVCSLGEVVLMPIGDDSPKKEKLRKSATEKVEKIKRALFGADRRQEVPESMAEIIGFCSEWLSKLSEVETEQAGLGRLASDWRVASLDMLSSSMDGGERPPNSCSFDDLAPPSGSHGAHKLAGRRGSAFGSAFWPKYSGTIHSRLLAPTDDSAGEVFKMGLPRMGDPPLDSLFNLPRAM